MQLFGSFCLENDGARLDEKGLHSKKLTKLLAYIILNRDQVLSRQTLMDTFWEEDFKNPSGALKNLMYRLREALRIFGDEEYICTLPGAYQWNPDIAVKTDYERFVELFDAIRREEDVQRVKELCREAIACFNGNISSKLSGEPWILSRMIWYQSLYMDIVKILGEILEREGAWTELEALCDAALACDQLDEDIHYWIFKSLTGQKKYDLAMLHYEKVSKRFYGILGIRVTGKLQSAFRETMKARGGWETDIVDLISELNEERRPEGVFFCDYKTFRQIYRMEARRMDRSGMAEYLVLATVRRRGGIPRDPANDSSLAEAMDILKELLCRNLRMGDVAAQYNMTQFILLLPMCSGEACETVMERLGKQFIKKIGKGHMELIYDMEEVSSVGAVQR